MKVSVLQPVLYDLFDRLLCGHAIDGVEECFTFHVQPLVVLRLLRSAACLAFKLRFLPVQLLDIIPEAVRQITFTGLVPSQHLNVVLIHLLYNPVVYLSYYHLKTVRREDSAVHYLRIYYVAALVFCQVWVSPVPVA